MKHVVLGALVIAMAVVPTVAAQTELADDSTEVHAIGEIRRGEYVTVYGEVTRVRDYDTFVVEDETGRAPVYVRGGFSRSTIRRGESVRVTGWVDDDLLDFNREIYATEMVLEDGTVLEVRGEY